MTGRPNRLRRTLGGSLAALALSGVATATAAPAAAAPVTGADPVGAMTVTRNCPADVGIIVSGGAAAASFRCANGVLTIKGWVQDTAADGRCAQVRVRFPGGDWKNSQPACPQGDRETFSWQGPAPRAEIDLFTYAV